MSELPRGWVAVPLKDVCELLNGRAYKQDELLGAGKYPVLRVGNFFTNRGWYYSDLELAEDKYCDNGDLLYAWSASFGPKIWDGGKVIYHYHIWKTRLDESAIDKKLLYHWFDWDKENIKAEHGTGSTMIHVTKGDMEARRIALPPITEQRRIAAKLDSLRARSSRARNELDRIPKLIERYKQAILAKAFSGELTADWRAAHTNLRPVSPRELVRRQSILASEAPFEPPYDIPESWRWLSLPQLGELDRGRSRHRPRNDARLFGGDYPFIQTGEVRAADRYLNHFTHTYSEFGLAQSRLWPIGTVCITIAANIAETAILGIAACFPDSVVGFTADQERTKAEYIEYFVRTVRADLERFAPATAQKNINLETLYSVRVPSPPLREQKEIVRRLDHAFAWLDKIAAEYSCAEHLLPKLDQAILAKAFRGELVPQDPNDEPASELLARIAASSVEPKPRTRRKKDPA